MEKWVLFTYTPTKLFEDSCRQETESTWTFRGPLEIFFRTTGPRSGLVKLLFETPTLGPPT